MRPAQVVCHVPDVDEPTTIVPRGQRHRWENLIQAVPPASERIELQDAKGNVLAAMDIEKAATPGTQHHRDLQLLELLNRAQDRAVERVEAVVKDLVTEYRELAKVLSGRLESLEKSYASVLQASFDATVLGAEAVAKLEGKSEEDPTIGLLTEFLKAKGILPKGGAVVPKKQLTDKAAPPKNGTTAPSSGGGAST